MRRAGLRARQKRRFRPRTTDSRHLCPIAPNHLAERAEPARAARRGVAGRHHLRRHQGGLALRGRRAGCLLAPDRGLGGGRHDAHRAGRPRLRARRPAQRPSPGLLHHSDRGSQYASDAYRELLRRHGVLRA